MRLLSKAYWAGHLRTWLIKRELRRSELFDSSFYIGELRARGYLGRALKRPFEHFWETGAYAGIRPSKGFDPAWYLKTYRDVQRVGLNPLGHYLRYGKGEGRLPFHGASVPYLPEKNIHGELQAAQSDLWRGFEHLAKPLLERKAKSGNADAAFALASWYFVGGLLPVAEQWLARVPDSEVRKVLAVSKLSVLFAREGKENSHESKPVQSIVEQSSVTDPTDMTFVNANGEENTCKRVEALKPIFKATGLSPLTLKSDAKNSGLLDLEATDSLHPEGVNGPLVTVIVPAFNAEQTLPIALEGLLAQTWRALDIVVVDDASTDRTLEIAERYAARDSRITVISRQVNMGAYPSRNEGLAHLRGDFVTVHDSDDWSHPQKLAWQVRPLLADRKMVASCSYSVRTTDDVRFLGAWQLGASFLEENASSWLVRREVMDLCGPWDMVNVGGDNEFVDRVIHHYGHDAVLRVAETAPLSFTLTGSAGLTRKSATHIRTQFYGLRRVYREAYQWWHRATGYKPVMLPDRPFPVPLGNIRDRPERVDVIFVANFAAPSDRLESLLKWLEREVGRGVEIAIAHWPDYTAWHGNTISDDIFSLCQRKGIYIAHAGLMLDAARVVLADEQLWRFPPSSMVRVPGVQTVQNLHGERCAAEPELIRYFSSGGHDVA